MAIFYILALMVVVSIATWILRWAFFFLYPLPSIIAFCFAAFAHPPYWTQVQPLPLIPRMVASVRLTAPRIVAIVRYLRVSLKGHFNSVVEAAREGNGVIYRPREPEQVGLIWPPAPQINGEEQ